MFADEFFAALGAWQLGWREEKELRIESTDRLRAAMKAEPILPPEALSLPEICYRKRFLVPNNPQNGGDFWPFFWEGEILEGVASWTTDYDYCKVIFKKDPRPGTLACIFRRAPKQSEIVLNIGELWKRDDFRAAAASYIGRRGENFESVQHFQNKQSEVILDAPLSMNDVIAFCGQVPSLDQLCATAGITEPDDEEELWKKLGEANLLHTLPYWLEGNATQRAIDGAIAVIEDRFKSWLIPKKAGT